MIIMIIIIIELKGAIRDFLQSPHCAANCLQHVRSSGLGAIVYTSRATHTALITCNTHSAHHVQHTQRSSRATHTALITCNTHSAHHVQHTQRSSRATHTALITCNVLCATWYEGTAQLLNLPELKSHLFEFYLLAEPLADEGGADTGVMATSFRKWHTLKPDDSSPKRDSNPHKYLLCYQYCCVKIWILFVLSILCYYELLLHYYKMDSK